MCLSIVRQTYDPPLQRKGFYPRYKVVRRLRLSFWSRPRYAGEYHGGPYKLGKWYKSESEYWSEAYPAGFHAFDELETARRWSSCERRELVVVKVELDRVVAIGTQIGEGVTVAERMRIVEEVQ